MLPLFEPVQDELCLIHFQHSEQGMQLPGHISCHAIFQRTGDIRTMFLTLSGLSTATLGGMLVTFTVSN